MNLTSFQKGRLEEAREARGLSRRSLAELVGVDESAVSHYESGSFRPSLETLRRIADVLKLPLQFFFAQPTAVQGPVFWRSQAAASKSDRTRAGRRFVWLLRTVDHLSAFISLPTVEFPSFDVPEDPRELSDESVETLAASTRKAWGLGNGPIGNVTMLVENHGAIVVRHGFGSESLDAFSHWHGSRPFIVLGSDKDCGPRSVFDLSHELAHLLLHRRVPERLFKTPEVHKLMESQAMRFAGAFLLPPDTFASDLYSISLEAFVALKSKWRVAIQAMIMRASALGILEERESKNLWIRLVRRGWKRSEPLDEEIEVETPLMLRQCFDLLLDGSIDVRAIAAALALPLPEIESVCGLPEGYLSEHRHEPLKFQIAM